MNMLSILRVTVVCLLLISLSGCAAKQKTVVKTPVDDARILEQLAGRVWVAEYIHGRPVVDMSHSSMIFTTDGKVSGSSGCNSYTGSYTLKDGKLSFGTLAATMKLCAHALNDQETRFFRSLGAAQTVTFKNGLLMLIPEGAEPSVYAEQGLD